MIPELTRSERRRYQLKHIAAAMFSLAGGFRLFRRLARPGITIIAYHRIVEDDRKGIVANIAVRVSALRDQIRFFKQYYRVISLEEALARLRDGRVDAHYIVLTFDDGYRDFLSLGLPVFQAENVRPVVFLTTGCMDDGFPLWPDIVREIVYGAPPDAVADVPPLHIRPGKTHDARIHAAVETIAFLKTVGPDQRAAYLSQLRSALSPEETDRAAMLSWDEVRTLDRAQMSLGAHTVRHMILSRSGPEDAEAEIRGSRDAIAAATGKPVATFAYPNGTRADFETTHMRTLEALGFAGAVTTERGINFPGSDPFRLSRTGVYLTDHLSDIQFKLAFEYCVSLVRRLRAPAPDRVSSPEGLH